MKKPLAILGALAALLLLIAGGAALYLRSALPDYRRDAALAGLGAPVEVWRDSLGVPHLWAENERDLFRATGYVHAQDRLWQMELFRRVADGRLAEVLGRPALESDRFLRTLGMGRAAAGNEQLLDTQSRALLQAYADGVNAWITTHPGALPPEFVALRFSPEPWTVRNTLSIAKIMAWDLAAWETGLQLQRAVDRVGPERARELVPRYPEWGVTILGTPGSGVVDESATIRYATALEPGAAPLPRIPPLAARLLDGVSIARASNSWVIAGNRTRSGKPILANDMHLALRAPSLWYLASLHGGGINTVGMTLPGVPVVIAGHSDRVAWGFTNAMVDDVDFFIERVDSADSTRYLTPEGWRRFEVRPETIRVKGAEPVVQVVRTSYHGPVLSDVHHTGGDRVLAMRWTAHEPSTEFRALIAMNRAKNGAEFLSAIRDFTSPHQNIVFADADGRIGYWMAGHVPVRRSGEGLLPVPGWTGEGDWVGALAWDDHPHLLDPVEGFIVTANNRQAGANYPFHITSEWAEPYRAMRIREMLEAGGAFTAEEVARQQMDVRDALALRYLPHALRAAASDSATLRELSGWNGEARADSRAAALFYTWYELLRRRVGADEYGDGEVYFPRAALNRVLDAGDSPWVDDVRTPERETLAELSAAAMRDAAREVAGRGWSELFETRIDHALSSVAALDRLLGLTIGPFPTGGSPNAVNVAHNGGGAPPYRNGYGPSQRHVVDLADPDGAGGFVIPTGQSGIPFSKHYRDQTPLWREGRLWPIPLERTRAEARIVARMTLRPR